MFAYCNNNPVNGCDPCGTCFHNWKFYNCEKCAMFWDGVGKWCVDTYDMLNSIHQQQAQLQTQITMQQNKIIADAAKEIWNAYQKGYKLEQEAITFQAKSNIDMFDSPEDIERSIDAIEATVGFSVAAYELAVIATAATPPVGAVAIAVLGVVWSIRSICRAIQ